MEYQTNETHNDSDDEKRTYIRNLDRHPKGKFAKSGQSPSPIGAQAH
ncbi:MAG TPA: hypothetical protein VMX33_04830 [bacterium]|nr:hypothetical protein [bacterium]